MPSKNSSKSTSRPRDYKSAIMLKMVGFLAQNPRLCMADLSSRGSILPVASVSKRLKASLSSSISSSVSPGRSTFFLAGPLATGLAPLVAISNPIQLQSAYVPLHFAINLNIFHKLLQHLFNQQTLQSPLIYYDIHKKLKIIFTPRLNCARRCGSGVAVVATARKNQSNQEMFTSFNNIQKMKENQQGYVSNSRDPSRETTFGYNSLEFAQIDSILHDLLVVNQLSLPYLISVIQRHPFIREQSKLVKEVFKRTELVQDMIAFLLQPHRMIAKYKLKEDQCSRFVKTVAFFIKQNLQFYELFFIALEENSDLVEITNEAISDGESMRRVIDPNKLCLDQWFTFLQLQQPNRDELSTSLGYFAQVFLPFIKYEFSASSSINDYYDERYKKQFSIWLIPHFHKTLVNRIIRFTHLEPIFKCLFSLVLMSLEQQEWKYSLDVLGKLCKSVVVKGVTSDLHIENIYKLVKQVSDNISSDKNRTVFAFVSAIIKAKLVHAAISRLTSFIKPKQLPKAQSLVQDKKQQNLEETTQHPQKDIRQSQMKARHVWEKIEKFEQQWIIQMNIKLLVQIVNIYYLLAKNGIDLNANKMRELRQDVLHILHSLGSLMNLVRQREVRSISFSNGEMLRATPIYKYEFFNLVRIFLLFTRDHGEQDYEIKIEDHLPKILELIQTSLAENRWNSIMHCQIQKLIGLIITTEFFKTKIKGLKTFLDFIMEYFINKKYVFLTSTRMTNQGDIQSLYNICRKITVSFEKASLQFGLNNQYEQWRSFVINVLQNYEQTIERTSSIQCGQYEDYYVDSHEPNQPFAVQIDQVNTIKQIINRIDIRQKWAKRQTHSSKAFYRSTSSQNLDLPKTSKTRQIRQYGGSPGSKPRGSIQQQKLNKVFSDIKIQKKLSSSTGLIKQQLEAALAAAAVQQKIRQSERINSRQKSQHSNSHSSEGSERRKSLVTKQFDLDPSFNSMK